MANPVNTGSPVGATRPKVPPAPSKVLTLVEAAESFAENCVRDNKGATALEFEQHVVLAYRGLSTVPERINNVLTFYGQYDKLLSQLSEGDKSRVETAKRRALGTDDGNPQSVMEAARRLQALQGPTTMRMPMGVFYKGLFGRRADGLERGELLRLFDQTVESVAPGDARFLKNLREQATGLAPGTAGNARKDARLILQRALSVARNEHDHGRSMSIQGFQRAVLDYGSDIPDTRVGMAYFQFRQQLNPGDRSQLDEAFHLATGKAQVEKKSRRSMDTFLEDSRVLAKEAVTRGEPFTTVEFNKRLLGSKSDNPPTLAAEVSRYRARLEPEQRGEFDKNRNVALGKASPAGGQVFAPDAGHLEEMAELAVKWGSAIFVPSERLPDTQSTPLQPIDPKALQLPGLVVDVLDIIKPLGFPVGSIDWRKFAVPPSECRPHTSGQGSPADDGADASDELPLSVGLPEDLAPPVSLASTPIPRITLTLTPTTVGILAVAGLLVLADGPLLFGDAAAVSLFGGLLRAN